MAQPGVNRGELRTLVQGAFSAAKIVEMGTAWGLEPSPEWARSATEAAHGLVRDGEKKLGIQECIRRLRVAEPLIEWPDVDEAASSQWGPPSARAPASSPGVDPETTVVATPEAIRAAGSAPPAATVPGAPVGPSAEGAGEAPVESKATPRVVMAPFPGTEAAEPRRNGIDPRIVLAIGGVVLAIAVIAFAAGLLWSRGSSRPESTVAASPTSSARLGPALLAAGILENHVLDVASRCSVPSNAGSSREVLELAILLCDRKAPVLDEEAVDTFAQRKPSDATEDIPDPDDAEPRSTRPKTPRDPGGQAPRPAPATGGGCLSKCKTYKSSCMSQCGSEPADASKYDEYAGCTSKCVSAESRCRLACH